VIESASPDFRTIVLDVDSTLCGLEGIDWLASRRGEDVARAVAEETERAMRGEIALEHVYAKRLAAVSPTSSDIEELSLAYTESVAPGAHAAIEERLAGGLRVILVSGGIRPAILPLARMLGVPESDVHAVSTFHDASGAYSGFDQSSPLSVATGKRNVVASARLPRPILAVGDGATDLAMRDAADCFVAFTGFATRPEIVARADRTASSFEELREIVNRCPMPDARHPTSDIRR